MLAPPPAVLFQSQSESGSAGDGRLNKTFRRKRPSPRDFQPVHQAAKQALSLHSNTANIFQPALCRVSDIMNGFLDGCEIRMTEGRVGVAEWGGGSEGRGVWAEVEGRIGGEGAWRGRRTRSGQIKDGGGERGCFGGGGGWTERADGESGGGGERKRQPVSERRERSRSLAPGATFLSAVASLSAKCTFDASPRMLL